MYAERVQPALHTIFRSSWAITEDSCGEAVMRKVTIGVVEHTALGAIWLAVTEHGLAAVGVRDSQALFSQQLEGMGFNQVVVDQDLLAGPLEQMKEYLSGDRRSFDFPIDWSVLPSFQQSALQATWAIPYGQTRTYAQIASQVGQPTRGPGGGAG